MHTQPSSEAMVDLIGRQDEMLDTMVREWTSSPDGTAPWKVVPAERLVRVWNDVAELGFVRDERAVEFMAERMVENVLRLAVNNEISGHEAVDPSQAMEGRVDPEEQEAFVDWAITTPSGGWRISDHGLSELFVLAALLTETVDHMDKIVVMDRMLNVTHPRSDLASWFVEGGSRTLDLLAGRPSEDEEREVSQALYA